jgi:O-antigen/teichoic acid export membrane protein
VFGLRQFFAKFQRQGIARNASWMFGGQATSVFVQAAYFVLLARLLGAKEYGVFAGAFGLIGIVTPYSALGAGMLFMRYVPKQSELAPVYWGNSLLLTFVMSSLLAAAFAFLGPYYTHIDSPAMFVLLTVANCLFSQITLLSGFVYQSFEKMHYTATLILISNSVRLCVLVLMKVIWRHATALQWTVGITVGTGIAALWSIWITYRKVGGIAVDVPLALTRLWEGIGYSFAGSTQAIYNDVDKTLLSHYGMNAQNGPYTLAYRICDFGTAPIGAVDSAILPRFFLYGEERIGDVVRLAKKSLRAVLIMGAFVAVALLLVAPLAPMVAGKDFRSVTLALCWLCCLPLLRGIHRVSGSALTGLGYQSVRTVAQLIVALVNLGLNLWWIPRWGWIAAAWSSVASDALLAASNGVIFIILTRRAAARQQDQHLSLSLQS